MKNNTHRNCVIQVLVTIATLCVIGSNRSSAETRPNILFCISDDQSYAHTGANGDPVVQTPAFDRIAREGLRFTHAFCDAPTCGPSRSAMLTGQHIWRLEEGGNIHSTLPAKLAELAFGMRPAEELYDLSSAPHQMVNVAGSTAMAELQTRLRKKLFDHLKKTNDPRVVGGTVDWDYYPYYGKISTKGWSVDEKPR